MVAHFVDEDVGDDGAEGVVVLGPVVEDGAAVEVDSVGQPAGGRDALLDAADSGEEAHQIEFGFDAELVDMLSMALEDALARLEGGYRSIVVGSGKTAITSTLLALLDSGDHLLVTDSVYAPTRIFCTGTLARLDASA